MGKSLNRFLSAAAMLALLFSCGKKTKVIPRSEFREIYREMFLADQWLEKNPEKMRSADTTWFYEPIFRKYGYTPEDYRNSVQHYLSDPERYANLMRKVRDGLQKEAENLFAEAAVIEKRKAVADSIARVLKKFSPKDIEQLYFYPPRPSLYFDSLVVEANQAGAFYFVPVLGDTTFNGPEIVVRKRDAENAVPEEEEALEPEETELRRKLPAKASKKDWLPLKDTLIIGKQ